MANSTLASMSIPMMFGGENYEYWSCLSLMFGGENYEYWFVRMRAFLMAHDQWEIVEEGYTPQELDADPTVNQMRQEKDRRIKNMKALTFLHSSVTETIFPKIVAVTTAKEVWDKLQEEYKGSEQVRAVRLQTLSREFENLRMKDAEFLKDYSSRVANVVNQLKLNGEDVPDKRVVQKMLITLPEKFDAVTTAIEHTKDLSSLSLTELTGALLAYEQRLTLRYEVTTEGALAAKFNRKVQVKVEENNTKKGRRKAKETHFLLVFIVEKPTILRRSVGRQSNPNFASKWAILKSFVEPKSRI
ncbi:uncharacterized protein LOC111370222 [Olea europaea var. sylvestris]|uniref:uncharacterized protein LOC111370222 n=1 Tax=Olea europaea var. sylvestris TaxID=158386 RepID=UPI000C1D5227|nr:uncharacterized protein LOC111370222 [Olea europaea var. sylvestris]